MKRKIKGNSLFWVFMKLNILPVVVLTLVITAFSATLFASSMNEEAENGLINLCSTVTTMYDMAYSGDYDSRKDGDTTYFLKGNHRLNGDFTIIDLVKEKTNVDITLFCCDTRVLTTIRNENGERVVGTKADDEIFEDVFKGNQANFYSDIMIGGVRYFSYYEPLHASDGTCIGMIFVGKPSEEVEQMVFQAVSPIIVLEIVIMLVICCITIRFSRRLVSAIRKIEVFLEKVSGGNLHEEFDSAVLERTDELGEMGRYLIRMQASLRGLVEQDMLTGLHNRRSGEKLLRQVHDNYVSEQTPFCVAIGDIDYFKKVNDTYGHECGDVVLAKLASLLNVHMRGRGFAVRWGGEEFLLVYRDMHLNTAVTCIQEMMREIRNLRIQYEDLWIDVTMTFGLVEGSGEKVEHIIRDADEKLYEGKNSGRNKLIYENTTA